MVTFSKNNVDFTREFETESDEPEQTDARYWQQCFLDELRWSRIEVTAALWFGFLCGCVITGCVAVAVAF